MQPKEKDFERLKNSGRKAVMKLKRLPTNEELEKYGCEASDFIEAFHKQSVGNDFRAYVRDLGDVVELDNWRIIKADWFEVESIVD